MLHVVPDANMGAHGTEISIQMSALAGVEPRTLASSGREQLPLDYYAPPPFSRLLRHAGGYSGTILTPNPQAYIIRYKNNISRPPYDPTRPSRPPAQNLVGRDLQPPAGLSTPLCPS